MLCRRPFIKDRTGKVLVRRDIGEISDGIPFPCGQCLACRINKRRQWTLRLLLEFFSCEKATFLSLTHSDDNLPLNLNGNPVLCKRDVQLFFKRLRKRYGEGLRYYVCGEYGEKFGRPHYHAIVFGLSPDELDPDWFYFNGKSGCYKPGYTRDSPLYKIWGFGVVHVGEVNRHSIQYVAGYVTKKLTRKGDGRAPEFSLMSRKPGLGLSAVSEIARYLQAVSKNCASALPSRTLAVDGKCFPLGRYLLHKLAIVSDVPNGTEEFIRNLQRSYSQRKRQYSNFLEFLVEENKQAFVNLEAKENLFHPRGDL